MRDLVEIVKPLFIVSYIQMHAQEHDEGIFGIFNIFQIVEMLKDRTSELNLDDAIEMYNNEYVEFEEDLIKDIDTIGELIHKAFITENESLLDCLLEPLNLEMQPLLTYLNRK